MRTTFGEDGHQRAEEEQAAHREPDGRGFTHLCSALPEVHRDRVGPKLFSSSAYNYSFQHTPARLAVWRLLESADDDEKCS
jgi:hypothetical protein